MPATYVWPMSSLAPFTKAAYQAQQAAVHWSLVALHLGLRPFVTRKNEPDTRALQALRERLSELVALDLANVERGAYPSELLFQLPVREYLAGLPKLAGEVTRMIARARRGRTVELPRELDLSHYPEYFRRNFHWQTDGYFSSRSAELYDLGVEFLFLGTADIMRRQIIPPLAPLLAGPEPRRVLDVACGTGRSLYQLSRAYPRHRYFGVDLSPFYIERARELLRGRSVSLLVENAESLTLRDASFDAVTSTFLLHELPKSARHRVLAEMRRVLSPGGLLVLEDAAQLGDAPELEVFLKNFAHTMNEPYFKTHIESDLATELAGHGFRIVEQQPAFLAKVVVARAE
ncbi:MAG TPA: class I SAM-dependent methyltransferase [Polyangiaceae bacterium]|nr:class I SAM-dependent methyltransferase [Polyangiaceae bacterium]